MKNQPIKNKAPIFFKFESTNHMLLSTGYP